MSVFAMSWAWEQEATAGGKLVLLAVADHADPEGECYPSRRRLAKMTGLGRSSVSRYLAALETRGLLQREPRHRENGSRTSTLYRLPLPGGPMQDSEGGGSAGEKGPSAQMRRLEPSIEPSYEQQLPELFDFWKTTTNRNGRTSFTPERKKKLKARLADGYSPAEIEKAIRGCWSSDFHRNGGYTDLTLICRSPEKLEGFRDMDPGEGGDAFDKLLDRDPS